LKRCSSVDVVVLPATLTDAPTLEAAVSGGWEAMRDRIGLPAPFNLTGGPAVSVPCGFTAGGLPVGLQIAGPLWTDRTVLALARVFEDVAGVWRWRPPLTAPGLSGIRQEY
jgi:Asp-tRNA(Asn)/Glu-tRNA(Gln) amidotransferase A subunit family amidase